MTNYKLSGFADEIDPCTQIQFEELNKLGIKYFEPRGINGKSISELTEAEAIELKKQMDSYGIKASSVGSPIGKISITDDFEKHLKLLSDVIRTAKIIGTKYIRVFSFFMNEKDCEKFRDEVMVRMKAMTALAEKNDIILLHENEKGIYGNTALRCADILKTVNSPNLQAVFDPANFVQCGQVTYPDGYEIMKPYITYMHIKDALSDGSVVPSGMGIGNLKAIISDLRKNGYNGFFSLEPHLTEFVGFSELEKSPEKKEKTNGKVQFKLAYDALIKILNEVK